MIVAEVDRRSPIWSDFRWQRIRVTVVKSASATRPVEHPLAVFDAMGRQARRGLSIGAVLLRAAEHHVPRALLPGMRFELEYLLVRGDVQQAIAFAQLFRERIFGFTIDGEVQIDEVAFDARPYVEAADATLWFRTPLPVASKKGRLRLSGVDLAKLLAARVKAVFGVDHEPPTVGDVRVYAHLSRYTKFGHASKSAPGEMWLQGHVGPIFLRGDYQSLWPWLCLCEQIGIGKELGFGLGQFRLDAPAPAVLAAHWTDLESLARIADDVVERYDRAQAELAAESAIPFDARALAIGLGTELASGSYAPLAHQAFMVEKSDGGERRVEFPACRDLVVAHRLKEVLEDPLDRLFEPSSLGFRKGHSRTEAAARIDAAVAEGFAFVVESDVEDFFPSVDHERLEALLREIMPAADEPLVAAVMRLVRAEYTLEGKSYRRERGLAQGNPLSPLLANLYLNAFDETMGERDACLVRYADDFVLLARTREEAEALLHEADNRLESIGLHLKLAKTRVTAVQDGFSFLGLRFPRDAAADEHALAVHGRKPLYVTERGIFLGIAGDAVVLRKGGGVLDSVPLRRISEIFIFGHGSVSNELFRRCADFGVPLTFCVSDGYHVNTVAPNARAFFDVSYRQAERYNRLTDAERLEIARTIVQAKIANSQILFRQRHNERTTAAIADLDRVLAGVDGATDVAGLRGLEGIAARKSFAHWAGLIEVPGFPFTTRAREQPDRVNGLFNFGYHLLFTRLNVIVRGLGLNPYLGFLHESGDRYETLVSDLQEPFRANVDRLILTLVNQRSIKPEDFRETPRGLRLAGDASPGFVAAFERMLVRRPRTGGGMSPGAALYAQALSMKRYLCDGASLHIYRWQPQEEG